MVIFSNNYSWPARRQISERLLNFHYLWSGLLLAVFCSNLKKMDQSLLNFWKNYEDIIDWGYRISGARGIGRLNACGSTTREINTCANCNDEDVYSSDSSVDIDFEYLNFSKKTLEHQAKIQKEKKQVDKEYGLCESPSSENESVQITSTEILDPKELYGSKFKMIENLENNLQSEFDKFCSVEKPVLWPGMAFNLSIPEPELHLGLRKSNRPFLE